MRRCSQPATPPAASTSTTQATWIATALAGQGTQAMPRRYHPPPHERHSSPVYPAAQLGPGAPGAPATHACGGTHGTNAARATRQ